MYSLRTHTLIKRLNHVALDHPDFAHQDHGVDTVNDLDLSRAVAIQANPKLFAIVRTFLSEVTLLFRLHPL